MHLNAGDKQLKRKIVYQCLAERIIKKAAHERLSILVSFLEIRFYFFESEGRCPPGLEMESRMSVSA